MTYENRHHHVPPGTLRHVRLTLRHCFWRWSWRHFRWEKIVNDVTVNWTKTTVGTPTNYLVVWSVNGTAATPVSVPATALGDIGGYSLDYATSQPATPLKPGDVVGATVQANDAVNNLQGPVAPSDPTTVTIPSTPVAPGAPENVKLVLS